MLWVFAVGARKVDVDFDGLLGGVGIEFGVYDGNSAEEEVGDVSEHCSAASGDEVGG